MFVVLVVGAFVAAWVERRDPLIGNLSRDFDVVLGCALLIVSVVLLISAKGRRALTAQRLLPAPTASQSRLRQLWWKVRTLDSVLLAVCGYKALFAVLTGRNSSAKEPTPATRQPLDGCCSYARVLGRRDDTATGVRSTHSVPDDS